MTTNDLAALRRDLNNLLKRLADLEAAPVVKPEPPKLTGEQMDALTAGLAYSRTYIAAATRLRYLEAEVERLREANKRQPGDAEDNSVRFWITPGVVQLDCWTPERMLASMWPMIRELARRRGLKVPQ